MTPVDFAGIAQPHQSTAAAIAGLARLGLFTETEAEQMIERIRTPVDGSSLTGDAGQEPADGI